MTGAPVPGTPSIATSPYGRAGSRHAVDRDISVVANAPRRRLHDGLDQPPGVDHVDAHARLAVGGFDHASVDGERTDPGEHVPAGRVQVDDRPVDQHLGEQVVDIDVARRGRADDRDFAGERICAPCTVDLSGIRGSHRGEQELIAHVL